MPTSSADRKSDIGPAAQIPISPKIMGENKHKRDQDNYLAQQAKDDGVIGFADCLK